MSDPETGKSFEQQFGERMGARLWRSDMPGTVKSIDKNGIVVRTDDGQDHTVDIYDNFEFNRKT